MEVFLRFVSGSQVHLFASFIFLAFGILFIIRLWGGKPILRYKRSLKKIPGSSFRKRVKVELRQWEKIIGNTVPAILLCLGGISIIGVRMEEFDSSFDGLVLSKEKVKKAKEFKYYITLEKDRSRKKKRVTRNQYNLMTEGKYVRKLPQSFDINYDVQTE